MAETSLGYVQLAMEYVNHLEDMSERVGSQQEELEKYMLNIRNKSYIKVLIGDPPID